MRQWVPARPMLHPSVGAMLHARLTVPYRQMALIGGWRIRARPLVAEVPVAVTYTPMKVVAVPVEVLPPSVVTT